MMGMLSVNLASCGSDDDDEPTPPESLSVTPTEISLLSEKGSSASFTITTNGAWVASCASDWLHLSARNGNGNSMVTVTALTENSSSEVRTAQVLVQAGSLSLVVTVSQMAGLVAVKVVPVNIVALHDELAWEMEEIGTVNEYRMIWINESAYNRMNNVELLDTLMKSDVRKLNDQYLFAPAYENDGRKDPNQRLIVENTTYYICTVAFDMNKNRGEIVKTKVTTPAYVDDDNDAWVLLSFEPSEDIFSNAFRFTAKKEGFCNTYHAIYGNLPSDENYNVALYAYQINYYLKYGKKHWFASTWGLEIVTDYINDHTFVHYTNNLSTRSRIVICGWGVYKDGRVSSYMGGINYKIGTFIPQGIVTRNSESNGNMVIRRSVEEARAKKYR